MSGLFFLIRKPSVRFGPGWVVDCHVIRLQSASVVMHLDEASITAAIEEYGRCDVDTHTLIPVKNDR